MISDEHLDKLGARPLTVGDKLKIAATAACFPAFFLFQLVKFLVPSHPQYGLHWRQKVVLASLRAGVTFGGQERIRYAAAHANTTNDKLRAFAQGRKDVVHREVNVPIDAAATALNPATDEPVPEPTLHFLTGCWITGEEDASAQVAGRHRKDGPVVVYAHGGGYLDYILVPAHIPLARNMARACHARAVVFIAYSVCPQGQYPTQLVQAVESMRFLLDKEGIAPENMVLAGDSAGAHMIASVLANIVEPSPYAPSLAPSLHSGGQFRAVILISPWFTWTDAASLGTNKCDYLEGPASADLVAVLRPRPEEVWCEIVASPAARHVWARVFAKERKGRPLVRRMLVTASDSEVMYRDARIFAVDYAGCTSVVMGKGEDEAQLGTVKAEQRVFAIGDKEAHAQPGLDEGVKYHGGGTYRAIQAFMSSI